MSLAIFWIEEKYFNKNFAFAQILYEYHTIIPYIFNKFHINALFKAAHKPDVGLNITIVIEKSLSILLLHK